MASKFESGETLYLSRVSAHTVVEVVACSNVLLVCRFSSCSDSIVMSQELQPRGQFSMPMLVGGEMLSSLCKEHRMKLSLYQLQNIQSVRCSSYQGFAVMFKKLIWVLLGTKRGGARLPEHESMLRNGKSPMDTRD